MDETQFQALMVQLEELETVGKGIQVATWGIIAVVASFWGSCLTGGILWAAFYRGSPAKA